MRPTSDQAKESAGTFTPGRSRVPLAVPKGRPEAPDWLPVGARKHWDAVVPDLEASGVLAKVDQTMLAMFAILVNELATSPAEFTAAKYTQLRLICGELGLSISSRLKLRQPEGAEIPDPSCKTKSSGKVVSISSLLSGTPKGSPPGPSKLVDTSASPANAS